MNMRGNAMAVTRSDCPFCFGKLLFTSAGTEAFARHSPPKCNTFASAKDALCFIAAVNKTLRRGPKG